MSKSTLYISSKNCEYSNRIRDSVTLEQLHSLNIDVVDIIDYYNENGEIPVFLKNPFDMGKNFSNQLV